MRTVQLYLPAALVERIEKIALHDNQTFLRAAAAIVEAGCEAIEMQHLQGDRICVRCQAADGVEQGGYGDWYCRRCWKIATTEGS